MNGLIKGFRQRSLVALCRWRLARSGRRSGRLARRQPLGRLRCLRELGRLDR